MGNIGGFFNAMKTLEENVVVTEFDRFGTRIDYSFEGQDLIVKKTWDAEPWLKQAEADRQATEGQRWGDTRKVFSLSPVEYGRFLKETRGKGQDEKQAWLRRWALENPRLVSFDKYLKGLRVKGST